MCSIIDTSKKQLLGLMAVHLVIFKLSIVDLLHLYLHVSSPVMYRTFL
jgi:hypothetical protein